MSVLERIASKQGRRDEVPNRDLARVLVEAADRAGIVEIVDNLQNRDANIQSDCIKVLYEIGYLRPELIAPYVSELLGLLDSKHNRMVWGAMIALGLIAGLRADELYPHCDRIKAAISRGSVITVDNGMKILATIAGSNREYAVSIFPYLLDHLTSCRQKEVPQHAEKVLAAVGDDNRQRFIETVEGRMRDASGTQIARLKKVIGQAKAGDGRSRK